MKSSQLALGLSLLALLPHADALAGFAKPAVKKASKSKKAAVAKFDGKKTFEKQMRSWNALVAEQKETPISMVDVYVRSAGSEKFWFVGKSAAPHDACEDAGACSALVQKRLVLEHSKLLQLSLKTAKDLQMWCAPGNSEMKVAQKLESLRPLDGIKGARDALPMDACGFEPEQYKKANGEVEQGFYVRLDDNGQPKGESHVKVVPPEKLEEMRATGMLTG